MGGLCGAACNPMRWRSPFRATFKNKVSSWQRTTFPTIPVSLVKPSIAAYSILTEGSDFRGRTMYTALFSLMCFALVHRTELVYLTRGQHDSVSNPLIHIAHMGWMLFQPFPNLCSSLINQTFLWTCQSITDQPFFPSVFCLQINLLIDYSNSKDWHGLQENISHLYQQDDCISTQADTVRDSECKQWDTGRWWLDEIF